MPKVLLVTDSLAQGGAERQMALLATNLNGNWKPFVWSLHDGFFAKQLVKAKVPLEIPSASKYPLVSFKSYVQKIQPDIIHYWGTASLFMTYPFALFSGISCVSGIIRFGVLPPSHAHRFRLRLASKLCPIVISNSKAGLKTMQIPKKRGRVVYNGIDLSRFPSTEHHQRSDTHFRIVMCANMLNSKNHILLAKVAELALDKHGPNVFSFWSIGDFRDPTIFKEVNLIAKRSIASSTLSLLGRQSEPTSLMVQTDLGIHLSNREGLSNSVMEEMACRLPVIASDVGGMNELVNLETGVLDSSNSPRAILEQIDYFRKNPAIRIQMGINARERIVSLFSIDNMVRDTITIYNSLLGRI